MFYNLGIRVLGETKGTETTKVITEQTTDFVTRIEKMIPDNLLEITIIFGLKIIFSLLVWYIGNKIVKLLMKLFEHSLERAQIEISVSQFLKALVRIGLKAMLLIIIFFVILGIKSTSFVALVGSAGLTLGLALQGSLSNFAGGVLILIVKPFKVGDYIIEKNANNEGTVTAIDIFYTKLLTIDNKMVVIPNGALSNSSIINVTNEAVRRLDINVLVNYSENIDKVKGILSDIACQNEMVLKDHDILVFVNSFDPSAINIGMRAWVMQENYYLLKWEMLEKIKKAFDENNITIPFDQLDVNIRDRATNQMVLDNILESKDH
ncbi:mechanosensitive ion channel family protein [Anaeromicropila herbilytica]|uniref:Mechanosensitive ion channel protein MscS n=1 Tax=Anaeromicropila herbilytica TaxID=2785025 RepID=A0A7R7IFD3_9FIRM|nr:mechanosensitive ion channel domain-containing protein [Anaeromicropila herbilytica]BCN32018.1 mechanosensitive ion channel protein MscS [Anaeromicropila herbilytica]